MYILYKYIIYMSNITLVAVRYGCTDLEPYRRATSAKLCEITTARRNKWENK